MLELNHVEINKGSPRNLSYVTTEQFPIVDKNYFLSIHSGVTWLGLCTAVTHGPQRIAIPTI